MFRLTVLIPTRSEHSRIWLPQLPGRKALVERAIQSILQQSDPVGTDIILADDDSRDGTTDHVEAVFGDAIAGRRLRIQHVPRSGDPYATLNSAAETATGAILTFLDYHDEWLPGRLDWFAPLLAGHDLILTTRDPPPAVSSPLKMLMDHPISIMSLTLRHELFEECGEFPEGDSGFFLPRRLPGLPLLDLALRATLQLTHVGKQSRILILQERHLSSSRATRPTPVTRWIDSARRNLTLARNIRRLPLSYWPGIGRRLIGRNEPQE